MDYNSAVKLIAYRVYLGDIRKALSLVGWNLSTISESQGEDKNPAGSNQSRRKDVLERLNRMDGLGAQRKGSADLDGWSFDSAMQMDSHRESAYNALFAVSSRGNRVSAEAADNAAVSTLNPIKIEPTNSKFFDRSSTSPMISPISIPRDRIASALRRKVPIKIIDIHKTVDHLARAQPIRRLPVLRKIRVSRSVQSIFDNGLSVGPYATDVRNLLEFIDESVPPAISSRLAFNGLLSAGCGSGPIWTWNEFKFPHRSTVFFLISGNFGFDQEKRFYELASLLKNLHSAGHAGMLIWFGAIPVKSGNTPRSRLLVISD